VQTREPVAETERAPAAETEKGPAPFFADRDIHEKGGRPLFGFCDKFPLFTHIAVILAVLAACTATAEAHGVPLSDKALIRGGRQIAVFLYLGAKHMVTGYDHLLFLVGVIFFLYRLKEVGVYVTLFAVGHSVTLLYAVLRGTHVDAYLVDAVIGFSVAYKALDNMSAFKTWFGMQPDTKMAVLAFGFVHGLGLGTKLQEFALSTEGLVANLLAFNAGVEIGQLLALSVVLAAMTLWRRSPSFHRHAFASNALLLTAGFLLVGYQLTGYALE
jgi:hypothetical protein